LLLSAIFLAAAVARLSAQHLTATMSIMSTSYCDRNGVPELQASVRFTIRNVGQNRVGFVRRGQTVGHYKVIYLVPEGVLFEHEVGVDSFGPPADEPRQTSRDLKPEDIVIVGFGESYAFDDVLRLTAGGTGVDLLSQAPEIRRFAFPRVFNAIVSATAGSNLTEAELRRARDLVAGVDVADQPVTARAVRIHVEPPPGLRPCEEVRRFR
jgi:hypothetical protein